MEAYSGRAPIRARALIQENTGFSSSTLHTKEIRVLKFSNVLEHSHSQSPSVFSVSSASAPIYDKSKSSRHTKLSFFCQTGQLQKIEILNGKQFNNRKKGSCVKDMIKSLLYELIQDNELLANIVCSAAAHL